MEPERIQAEEADQLKREEEKNVQMAILASYNTGKKKKKKKKEYKWDGKETKD
jgi:hypothetical protein